MSDRTYDLLVDLAACLCAQIEEDGSPRTCFCGVLPGAQVAINWASNCSDANGMAWVRLMTEYPADGVGVASETVGNCGSGTGLQVEMGIMRRMSVGDSRGNPPTAQEFSDATDLQMKDKTTMRRALLCCSELSSKDFILGTYTPGGPLGEMVGGTWAISLAL